MWAPIVAWQISKRYSSACHVFISMWGVISSTASVIHCLKSARSRNFLKTYLITNHRLLSEERLFSPAYYYAVGTSGYIVKCHITSVVLLFDCLQTNLFISIEDNS
jgi:hypothetical protein